MFPVTSSLFKHFIIPFFYNPTLLWKLASFKQLFSHQHFTLEENPLTAKSIAHPLALNFLLSLKARHVSGKLASVQTERKAGMVDIWIPSTDAVSPNHSSTAANFKNHIQQPQATFTGEKKKIAFIPSKLYSENKTKQNSIHACYRTEKCNQSSKRVINFQVNTSQC